MESPQRKFQKKQESSTRTLYSLFQSRKNTDKNEGKDNNKKLDKKAKVTGKDTATAQNEDKDNERVGEKAEVTDKDPPIARNEDDDNEKAKVTDENTVTEETSLNQCGSSSNSNNDNKVEDISALTVAQKIMNLFLVEMPKDFFDFYEFCKSISSNNPLAACKSVQLKLVGPYDVLGDKINCENEDNKEKYLTHWRYYYDLPEFQVYKITIHKF